MDAVCSEGSLLPFPLGTENLYHEIELVMEIGEKSSIILTGNLLDFVSGYAVGLDLTRHDLQSEAKKGHPWATTYGFDNSPLASLFILSAKLDTRNVRK